MRLKWVGLLEEKERCPDNGRWHMHVCIQTHHTRRKRNAEVQKWFTDETADVTWPSGIWIAMVRCKLECIRHCKKDGDWNLLGKIFCDDNKSKGRQQDRHDLRNAICDEDCHDLKELRCWFPNQISNPGGEAHARKLINNVTPVCQPEKFNEEHLWERELRCKLMQPDNGQEIITVHSMQTRQGKSQMMQHLCFEHNQRKDGSALNLMVAPAKDLIATIKDCRHSLELLVIEIPKAKGDAAFLRGMFSSLELIENGEAFASKFNAEPV